MSVKKDSPEVVEVVTAAETGVSVRLPDTSVRIIGRDRFYLAIDPENHGYLIPAEYIAEPKDQVTVGRSVLQKSQRLYEFTEEIKRTMPTEQSIREALWLRGAYGKDTRTRENVRGLFPSVLSD